MASQKGAGRSARQVGVTLVLAAVAGFVDVFGYVSLDHVYTAATSGNTVSIAYHAARNEPAAALVFTSAVAMFFAGLLISGFAIEIGLRRGMRRVLSMALLIEASCLGAFAYWGAGWIDANQLGTTLAPHRQLFLLIALAALAMGIQNTSLRMAGVMQAFTTHVTGALTRFSEQIVNYVFGLAGQRMPGRSPLSLAQTLFPGGLWLAYLAGGSAASVLGMRWRAGLVLLIPIAVLLLIALLDIARPLAEPRR